MKMSVLLKAITVMRMQIAQTFQDHSYVIVHLDTPEMVSIVEVCILQKNHLSVNIESFVT